MTDPNAELSALVPKLVTLKLPQIKLVQLLVPVEKLFVKLLKKLERVLILMKTD